MIMNGEEIVRTYSDMVYKIAMRYVRNPADAEDVYSETFLAYFKKERTFESEEHRKAWLIRVTINCAKDMLSGRTYDVELDEGLTDDKGERTENDEILDLRRAIKNLPDAQREVITLFYLQDLKIKEIAEILDKPENTIKVTLMRAREALKTQLEG